MCLSEGFKLTCYPQGLLHTYLHMLLRCCSELLRAPEKCSHWQQLLCWVARSACSPAVQKRGLRLEQTSRSACSLGAGGSANGLCPWRRPSFAWCSQEVYSICKVDGRLPNSSEVGRYLRNINNPFLLILNVPLILKTGIHLQFPKISVWPIWLLIDPL